MLDEVHACESGSASGMASGRRVPNDKPDARGELKGVSYGRGIEERLAVFA
jgi:hypothetical protein